MNYRGGRDWLIEAFGRVGRRGYGSLRLLGSIVITGNRVLVDTI